MTVALKLYRKSGSAPLLMSERSFEARRITIGRGAECSVVLDDPKKWVSRVHAELGPEGDTLWLTVVSKVNPVFVNGARHEPGSRLTVEAGDRVEIGEYEIEVLPPPAAPPAPPPAPAAEATFIGEPVPEIDFVLDAGTAPAGAAEPAAAAPAVEPEPEPAALTPPAPVEEPTAPIEEPATPIEEPTAPAEPVAASAPDSSVFAEATHVGGARPADVFDEPTFVGKPPAAPQEESVEDSVLREVTMLRNLPPPEGGIFEAPAKPREEEVPPEERSVFMERTMMRAVSAEATLPSPEAAAGAGLERALKVFLEGAGLPARELHSPEEMEQMLRQCGAIVRASVEGVMALLVARAEAKKEFRAEDRTMVASRDNNPLKLMADPKEAIDFLFDPKERSGGFLPPVQAVADAFDDVRAHEAALIAGMRAAVLAALRRFDPKALEEELSKSAGGLGLNRKAKLWDLFGAFQQKLARDAEDDFNKVFGREFVASYMAQVRQLRKK